MIRQPSGVRTKSSSYHSPQNSTCCRSPANTIGLKQITRDDAVSPSTRTEKLPNMCAYTGKFPSTCDSHCLIFGYLPSMPPSAR
ncbi:Uncharacterised protein [Mycobacterium tuberculosis]|nr:Uncharacterised protein [Mycobacterium tuberculosis]COX64361.1 Uncharacterised protein [Mycobacterium tuberculosis]